MLEDAEWTLEHVFLTGVTGKVNHLNCELEGKGKTVADNMCGEHFLRAFGTCLTSCIISQEFENRYCDRDHLEPHVSYTSNRTCNAEQSSATFKLEVTF